MNDYPIAESTEGNKKEKFSFSKDLDGVKKTVRGEQVENGWIICVEKEWTQPRENGEGNEYKYEEKKYVSKENPLDKLKKKKEDGEDIANSISSLIADIGSIVVD